MIMWALPVVNHVRKGGKYVSAVVEDLEKYFCSCVFIDVLFLFGIFVEMDICGGVC
jgi:hypothetical protein